MNAMSGGSRAISVAVALSAMLVVIGPLSGAAAQERKVSVSPSDLPPLIRKAIAEAFPKGEILRIEKEVQGKDVGQFDVEIRRGGKEYEVEISSEGKVIETKERPPAASVARREYENGELKEVSRNFFAICKKTGNVFYFGEDVDVYSKGKIVRHSGAWRADGKDSRAGIIMPGTILLGARHYQEIAPTAMDRAEILSADVTLKTPAGTFRNCLRVEETSGLDPDEKCYKTYAPGIGLIQDEDLLLTEYSIGKE